MLLRNPKLPPPPVERLCPDVPWEVTNQAHVHLWFEEHFGHAVPPLSSLSDAVASWPEYATSVAKIQATVDGYPGLYRDVQTYLQERMKEVLTGASGSIVVRIYGPDLATLRARADEVGKVLPKLVVAVIVEALDGGILDRAVHALDLTIGPGMARLRQAGLDAEIGASCLE